MLIDLRGLVHPRAGKRHAALLAVAGRIRAVRRAGFRRRLARAIWSAMR
jgi:hypothetical protein